MLWVDKHRPKDLADLELHPTITPVLEKLGSSGDMPHLLFYGPSGVGKKTRVMALLHHIYGPQVLNIKLDHRTIDVSETKSIDLATLSSPFHMDVNPSDAGTYDRVVVMQMISDIASTAPSMGSSGGRNNTAVFTGSRNSGSSSSSTSATAGHTRVVPGFKVIVLSEVDHMTRGAQQALRRTMEKYMRTCRLILICNSTSRLIAPLRSRCLGIRVPSHDAESIRCCIRTIFTREGIPAEQFPSPQFIQSLTEKCGGNLRRAVLMLEACRVNGTNLQAAYEGVGGFDIALPDWQVFIREAVVKGGIFSEQSPKKLHDLRGHFYTLLGQCIPGDVILKEMVLAILPCFGVSRDEIVEAPNPRVIIKAKKVVALAATFDQNMKLGTKPIMHLEAFAAGVMALIKEI